MGGVRLIRDNDIECAAGTLPNIGVLEHFVECVAPTRQKLLFILLHLDENLGGDLFAISQNVTDSSFQDGSIGPDGVNRDVPKITHNGVIYGVWSKGEINPQIIEKQFPRFPSALQIASAKVFNIGSQTEKFDVVVFFDTGGNVRGYCQFPEYAYIVGESLPMDVSHYIHGDGQHAKIIHAFAKELEKKE